MPSPRQGISARAVSAYRYQSIRKYQATYSTMVFETLDTALRIAVGLGTAQAIESARLFLASYDFASRNNLLLIGQAWNRAGRTAQQATVEAYDRMLIRGGRGSYSADRADRFSGHLRPALASGDFFVASQEGIAWGNLGVLNAQAAHWARLNFGAGARGESSAGAIAQGQSRYQRFSLVQPGIEGLDRRSAAFAEEVVQSGIGAFGPRPAFTMPAGRWFNDSGEPVRAAAHNPSIDQFYPVTNVDRQRFQKRHLGDVAPLFMKGRPTQGISPRRFLDVGVRTLVLAFGDELAGVINTWMKHEDNPIHRAKSAGVVIVESDDAWRQASFGNIPGVSS